MTTPSMTADDAANPLGDADREDDSPQAATGVACREACQEAQREACSACGRIRYGRDGRIGAKTLERCDRAFREIRRRYGPQTGDAAWVERAFGQWLEALDDGCRPVRRPAGDASVDEVIDRCMEAMWSADGSGYRESSSPEVPGSEVSVPSVPELLPAESVLPESLPAASVPSVSVPSASESSMIAGGRDGDGTRSVRLPAMCVARLASGMRVSLPIRDALIVSLVSGGECGLDMMVRLASDPHGAWSRRTMGDSLRRAFDRGPGEQSALRCRHGLSLMAQAAVGLPASHRVQPMAIVAYGLWWLSDPRALPYAIRCLEDTDGECTLAGMVVSMIGHDVYPGGGSGDDDG